MKTQAPGFVFGIRVLVGLAIVLNEIVFVNVLAPAGVEFVLSSALVTIALLIQLRFGLREHAGTPADIVVFIFNWLFLDLAPKAQLLSTPQQLVNTSSVTVDTVAMTNLACALFMLTFTFVYTFSGRRVEEAADPAPQREFTGGGIGIATFVCVVVV